MSFRTVDEFLALTGDDASTTAEKDLIKATQAGRPCYLCDSMKLSRPAVATDKTRIRASLLRLLITGGSADCALHERGVTLFGGWIEGPLDLAYCTARGQTVLDHCHFTDKPCIQQARFQLLSLDDTALPGLFAQGARIEGSLFLSNVTSTGTVNVNGAKIGGQLACEGSSFDGGKDAIGAQQWALNAQGMETGGSLFLRKVTATGTIDLKGARIGGQTNCIDAHFDGGTDARGSRQWAVSAHGAEIGDSLFLSYVTATGTVVVAGAKIGRHLGCTGSRLDGGLDAEGTRLWAMNAQGVEIGDSLFLGNVTATGTMDMKGARIGGQINFEGARLDGGSDAEGTQLWALNAQRMRVTESFLFRKFAEVNGRVDLTAVQVGDLADDTESWPLGTDELNLNGFTYDRLTGTAPTTFAARRDWLKAGAHWQGEFHPQPYTHFARVLRQMGHAGEARKVLMERETLLAAHRHSADRADYERACRGGAMEKCDAGWIWLRMTGAWIWSELTRRVAGYGYAPQRALYWALASVGVSFFAYFFFWRLGAMVPADAILLASAAWAEAVAVNPTAPSHVWQGPAATHYETFYSLAYALDVFLPIVDLGQQSTWSQTTATWWGWGARLYTWVLQAAGYVVTTLGAAAVTGVIQRNHPD